MSSCLRQHGQQVKPHWAPEPDAPKCVGTVSSSVGSYLGLLDSHARPCSPIRSVPSSLSQHQLSADLSCLVFAWLLGCCPSTCEQGEVAQVATNKRRFNLPLIFLPLSHGKMHTLASPALPLSGAIYKPMQLTDTAENQPGKIQ